jgi:hypothetical protein
MSLLASALTAQGLSGLASLQAPVPLDFGMLRLPVWVYYALGIVGSLSLVFLIYIAYGDGARRGS